MNRIHFLQAVWQDIILLESGGQYALLDTGTAGSAERIIRYLRSLGVSRLEFILISHFHQDHYGSLPALLRAFPVGRVFLKGFSGLNASTSGGQPADRAYNEEELRKFEEYRRLSEERSSLTLIDETTDRLTFGEFDFRLFGLTDALREMYEDPVSPYYRQIRFGENSNSVVLFGEANGTTVLLGSDAGNYDLLYPKYRRLLNQYARAAGKPADLFKVPHHFCGEIFDEETLRILKPRYAVATNERKTIETRFRKNLELFTNVLPNASLLCTDVRGYVFTLGENGELFYDEIAPQIDET